MMDEKTKLRRRARDWDEYYIPEPNSGCHIWLRCCNKFGYGHVFKWPAHRLAWRLFRGQIPEGFHVLHRCDNTSCVNPDHLFLGTQVENNADRDAKNRLPKGSQRSNAKLTDKQVLLIRQDKRSYREIAQDYDVHSSAISRVKNKQQYSHL